LTSLPWAELTVKGLFLFKLGTQVIVPSNKIDVPILMSAKYKQFLSAVHHNITSTFDYKTNSLILLKPHKVFCLNILNKIYNTRIVLLNDEIQRTAILVDSSIEFLEETIFLYLIRIRYSGMILYPGNPNKKIGGRNET